MRPPALVLVLLFAGCATFKNTPAQDAAEALFARCKAETGINAKLDRVEPNGRIARWRIYGTDSPTFDGGMTACLRGLTPGLVTVPNAAPRSEQTRADFAACQEQAPYPAATLTEVRPDGSFRYAGNDPVANETFKACMRGKGHSIR